MQTKLTSLLALLAAIIVNVSAVAQGGVILLLPILYRLQT